MWLYVPKQKKKKNARNYYKIENVRKESQWQKKEKGNRPRSFELAAIDVILMLRNKNGESVRGVSADYSFFEIVTVKNLRCATRM